MAAILQYHFSALKGQLPEACAIMARFTYVDDLLTQAENEERAAQLYFGRGSDSANSLHEY